MGDLLQVGKGIVATVAVIGVVALAVVAAPDTRIITNTPTTRNADTLALPGPRTSDTLALPAPRNTDRLALPGPNTPNTLALPAPKATEVIALPAPSTKAPVQDIGSNTARGVDTNLSRNMKTPRADIKTIPTYVNDIRIKKSTTYRDAALVNANNDKFTPEFQKFKRDNKDFPKGLQVNHRIPQFIAQIEGGTEAMADALRKLGSSDINDPRLLEYMSQTDNLTHYRIWASEVDKITSSGRLLTGDDIIDIMRKVESAPTEYINNPNQFYRPVNSI